MSNIDSVQRAVEECGGQSIVTSNPRELAQADSIILPGTGTFPEAIEFLRSNDLDKAIYEEIIENNIPFLGICLGMHLLASIGEEGEVTDGLNYIEGKVIRLVQQDQSERIPHMGWNEVVQVAPGPLFSGIPDHTDFYFIHSYHFDCKDKSSVVATTPYCGNFISAIGKDNIFGVQFHPEKSQRYGMKLLSNFLQL